MKISVIIAAYCGGKFIGEQIASLLEQTLPPDEIIVTDDSPDELTAQAVAGFADARIRYFHNERSLGVNGNFEKALSLACGDVIFFCDQDDVWKKDKIRTMVDALENSPHAAGVFCNSTVVNENLEPLGFSLWQMRGFSSAMRRSFRKNKQLDVFLKRVTCSTHNIAIRREVLPMVLPFPQLDPFYADTFLGLLLAAGNRWVMVEKELTNYRVHGKNLSDPSAFGIRGNADAYRKGLKKDSLAARWRLSDEICLRLPENTPTGVREKFAAFGRHYAVRSGYSRSFFLRGLQIAAEAVSLRYCRYSNGWKSIAADLFLFR